MQWQQSVLGLRESSVKLPGAHPTVLEASASPWFCFPWVVHPTSIAVTEMDTSNMAEALGQAVGISTPVVLDGQLATPT